tara:strand:+ start:226 stop:372 length:147 start_codon:yes stop_codon:yes gene_type:complete
MNTTTTFSDFDFYDEVLKYYQYPTSCEQDINLLYFKKDVNLEYTQRDE